MAKTAGIKLAVAMRRACCKYHARWCPSRRASIRIFRKAYCKAVSSNIGYAAVTLRVFANKKYPLSTKLFYEAKATILGGAQNG